MDYFTKDTLGYLKRLREHNTHEWFRAHKHDYENLVRNPALDLIANLQPALTKVSPHFVASPKKVGGSLFRVMKDTRFEHPAGPYKAWIGLRFFHQKARQVHSPGYYVHIQPGHSYLGGGIWRPDSKELRKIRDFMVDNPQSWEKARKEIAAHGYDMAGEALSRLPRGYEAGTFTDPLVEHDLLWKDFIWEKTLPTATVVNPVALQHAIAQSFADLAPGMDYLCAALDLEF